TETVHHDEATQGAGGGLFVSTRKVRRNPVDHEEDDRAGRECGERQERGDLAPGPAAAAIFDRQSRANRRWHAGLYGRARGQFRMAGDWTCRPDRDGRAGAAAGKRPPGASPPSPAIQAASDFPMPQPRLEEILRPAIDDALGRDAGEPRV